MTVGAGRHDRAMTDYPPTIADQLTPALREAVRLASAGYAVLWQLGIEPPCPGDAAELVRVLRTVPGPVPARVADQLAAAVEAVRALDEPA